MWPGLNSIFDLYSSKYLTKPPIPEGIEILSFAIFSMNRQGWNKPPFVKPCLWSALAFN